MKKLALGLCGLGLVLGLLAVTPGEQRDLSLVNTVNQLNGSWHLLGTITVTDGGSANNRNTQSRDAGGLRDAGAFDAGWGVVTMTVCDGGAHVVFGTGDNVVATGYDNPLVGDEKLYSVMKSNENVVAIKPRGGLASVACSVFKGQ